MSNVLIATMPASGHVNWKNTLIDPIENQVDELQAALEVFPADVLLFDPVMFAAANVAEDHDIPWAVLGITPLMLKSRDVPPFLLGMKPRCSTLGRLWTAFLYWFADQAFFHKSLQYFESKARQNGWRFKSFPRITSPYLHLQASVPVCEHPRSDLPPQVHYIGPVIPEPEVANRVEHAEAGINLRTAAPTREQNRSAAHTILSDQRFRKGAQKIQVEGARHAPPTEATILVEQLAITKRPVLVTQFQTTEFAQGNQLIVKAYV